MAIIKLKMPFKKFAVSFLLAAVILQGCVTDTLSPKYIAKILDFKSIFKVYREIEYSNRDGSSLDADVYVPQGTGPFPAVLLIHGGSWSSGSNLLMAPTARLLAQSNFVAININYSLLPDHVFPSQLEDCESALKWIRNHSQQYKINPEKIGVWGYSAGAQLAALLGTSTEANLQAVVAGSGPYDFLLYPHDKTINQYLNTTVEKNPELFKTASPLYSVSASTPPMFLYHGSWDNVVDPKHTLEMKMALDNAGVANELYWIRGLGHIPLFVFGKFADKAAIKFLTYYLKEK